MTKFHSKVRHHHLKDVLLLDFYTDSIGCKRPCSRPRRIEAEPRLNIRCISDASDGSVIKSAYKSLRCYTWQRRTKPYIQKVSRFFVPKSGFSGCYVLLRGGFKHKKFLVESSHHFAVLLTDKYPLKNVVRRNI